VSGKNISSLGSEVTGQRPHRTDEAYQVAVTGTVPHGALQRRDRSTAICGMGRHTRRTTALLLN